jgi:hypothetical protein
MVAMLEAISKQVEGSRAEAISFLQKLIRVPSPSGYEVNARGPAEAGVCCSTVT